MGRRHHLEQAYRRNIEAVVNHGDVEFVLLDYNSPDDLAAWVKTELSSWVAGGIVRYFRTTEPAHFHMAHAKNVAHRLATGDILINLDADNWFPQGFAEEVTRIFADGARVIGRFIGFHRGCSGRVALRREDFSALGGYDEQLRGWGYEDQDLISRARASGLKEECFSSIYANALQHSDAERLRYYSDAARKKNITGNEAQSKANIAGGRLVANRGIAWGQVKIDVVSSSGTDFLNPVVNPIPEKVHSLAT